MRTFAQSNKIITKWLENHADMWLKIEVIPELVEIEVMCRNQIYLDVSGKSLVEAMSKLSDSFGYTE